MMNHGMIRGLAACAAALLLTVGCLAPHNGGHNGNNNGDDPPSWVGVCKLRPIVVTSGGQSKWDQTRVSRYARWLDPGYRNAALKFDVLPVERMESEAWFTIDQKSEFYAMSEVSMAHSASKGELVVWFVDSIPVWSAGGIAQKPSNAVGKYQHGIAISANSSEASLMHEVGHALNLSHTWSDSFTDTPTRDSKDCSTEPCNAMTYCFDQRLPRGACLGKTFSKQQVSEIQKWASAFPRSQVVTARNVPPGAVLTYTENTSPEVD